MHGMYVYTYLCVYIYIYVCMNVCIYIYIKFVVRMTALTELVFGRRVATATAVRVVCT